MTVKPGWRRHTCTFAHEIDTQYADHSHQHRQEESYRTLPDMPHNDESNIRNQNGLQYGRGACGYVFDKLDLWSKLRPEDGGSGSIATDWRMQMPGVLEDVEALCLVCPHPYWLRQFIIRHDHIRWRAALDELLVRTAGGRDFRYMRCPKIDKSGEKRWLPAAGQRRHLRRQRAAQLVEAADGELGEGRRLLRRSLRRPRRLIGLTPKSARASVAA